MNYASSPQLPMFVCSPSHTFGGTWTSDKLEKFGKYLNAFPRVLLKQKHLSPIYIDAFAGSGSISYKTEDHRNQLALPLYESEESIERLQRGSAHLALETTVPYHRYIFIEKNNGRAQELSELKEEFPDRANSIRILNGDANDHILELTKKLDWRRCRAVLFLDPYGMQVKWSTLEAIATTRAIDVWYLVPVGIGIGRLLRKDGRIDPKHKMILNDMLGTTAWEEKFFTPSKQIQLFGAGQEIVRTANLDNIETFVIERLKLIFPKVAEKPARLFNSKNSHMYSFCFAASNPGRGGDIALKIASSILGK